MVAHIDYAAAEARVLVAMQNGLNRAGFDGIIYVKTATHDVPYRITNVIASNNHMVDVPDKKKKRHKYTPPQGKKPWWNK